MIDNNSDDEKEFHPVVLLKYGQLEHLQDLLYNGNIYVNSIEEIRKHETEKEGDFRNDPLEGIRNFHSFRPVKVTMIPVSNKEKEPIVIHPENIKYWEKPEKILGNICSFYGITTKDFINNELIPIDEKMKEFGTHFILIKNFDEFINRINKAIENSTRTTWYYGFVKYFNEGNHVGEVNLFKKRSRFKYQKEFRLYLESKSDKPLFIKIGNIEDIASIIHADATSHFNIIADFEKNICNIKYPIITD